MHGSGQTSGAGAVLGAVIGNEMERQRAGSYYRVTVDMDRGATQSVNVVNPGALRPGSRVKVIGHDLEIIER